MIHIPLLPEYSQHLRPTCSHSGWPLTSRSAIGLYSPAQRCCPFGDRTYSVGGFSVTAMLESSWNFSAPSRSHTEPTLSGMTPPCGCLLYITPRAHLKSLSFASEPPMTQQPLLPA